MRTDTNLSTNFMTRPADERFVTLEDWHARCLQKRERSEQVGVSLENCIIRSGDMMTGGDSNQVLLCDEGQNAINARLNHWSFGQLCRELSAPAGYLRTLPPAIAAMNLQTGIGLKHIKRDDQMVYLDVEDRLEDTSTTVRAITSPSYGRIYDSQLTGALADMLDREVWHVPHGVGNDGVADHRTTTLYAGDKDCFGFFCDSENPIHGPVVDTSDGDDDGTLYRGFYVWNSEVGGGSIGVNTFLFKSLCQNRIIWGQEQVAEFRMRHTAGAPHKFVAELLPMLEKFLHAPAGDVEHVLRKSAEISVGSTAKEVEEFLRGHGFTQSLAREAYREAEADGYNPSSVWGLTQAITSLARDHENQDVRLKQEVEAGKLLTYAAKLAA